MRLSRAYIPYLEKVLEYAHQRMSEYSPGDYCCLEYYGDPEYPSIVTDRTIYQVIRVQRGSLTINLLSVNITLPEFVVENIMTSERKDIIQFFEGNLKSYTANFSTHYKRPVVIFPFAKSYDTDMYPTMHHKDGVFAGNCDNHIICKMDKVAVKDFLEKTIAREQAEKRDADLLRLRRQREIEEREKRNDSISDDEISALRNCLKK